MHIERGDDEEKNETGIRAKGRAWDIQSRYEKKARHLIFHMTQRGGTRLERDSKGQVGHEPGAATIPTPEVRWGKVF